MRSRIAPIFHSRAQNMRQDQTQAEDILWKVLRRDQLGIRFRRQHPITPYIVDFVALDAKLVLELDGSVHQHPGQPEIDATRQADLEAKGYRVLRFENSRVLSDMPGVLSAIRQALASRSHPRGSPTPLNPPI